ncbi:TIGR00341 family protein [Wenzhouxiangella sediminis]|uniref:TIGR00341 family protein n=1 Tax=Wenzhouxiangella sediminis TaxID=1792836 RepID=A0A3E1K669_9GAMM|nr:TIGR00341 family protein [Wenzhouxiangella sediminis]RFF29511.1 TIGR00341 family protein [Wenzhouxiangella sediminis]
METRLIELTLPADRLAGLRERVEQLDPIAIESLDSDEDRRAVLRVLVRQGQVESFLDRFESLSERYDEIRMTVYAVEATLPVPPEPDEDDEAGRTSEEEREESNRLSRIELHAKIGRNAKLNAEYLWMVLFSSVVAAVGLVQGNVAVIVGAMVIAPLLGPNMALALATTLADTELGIRAVKTGMSGVALAVVLGVICGWYFKVDPSLPEIAMRTRINHLDLILALAAGGAGALATTSGIAGALVGVMVAVALLPPLLVAALLAGAGHWQGAVGAALLYSTNIAAVNLAAMTVFLSRGLTPRKWWEKSRAKRSATVFMVLWIVILAALAAGFIYYNLRLETP